jgi:hypothetical protein
MGAAFAVPTLITRATGAGWGTSAAFGQIAFVLAVTFVMVTARREPPPPADSS